MKKLLFIFLVLLFILASGCSKKECENYSIDKCKKPCVVCPPCEVCSSLKCGTKEFCESIGFNSTWYETIKPII